MEVLSQNGSKHIAKTENLKNKVFHKNGTNTNKSIQITGSGIANAKSKENSDRNNVLQIITCLCFRFQLCLGLARYKV